MLKMVSVTICFERLIKFVCRAVLPRRALLLVDRVYLTLCPACICRALFAGPGACFERIIRHLIQGNANIRGVQFCTIG